MKIVKVLGEDHSKGPGERGRDGEKRGGEVVCAVGAGGESEKDSV